MIVGLMRGDTPRFIGLGVGVGSVAMVFERFFEGVKFGWISLGVWFILLVHVWLVFWGIVGSFFVFFLLSDEGKFGLPVGVLCRCGSFGFGFGFGFGSVDDVFLLPSEFPANLERGWMIGISLCTTSSCPFVSISSDGNRGVAGGVFNQLKSFFPLSARNSSPAPFLPPESIL